MTRLSDHLPHPRRRARRTYEFDFAAKRIGSFWYLYPQDESVETWCCDNIPELVDFSGAVMVKEDHIGPVLERLKDHGFTFQGGIQA